MSKCKNCHKNFGTLTKEELCAFCYKSKYGTWANEFVDEGKKKKS